MYILQCSIVKNNTTKLSHLDCHLRDRRIHSMCPRWAYSCCTEAHHTFALHNISQILRHNCTSSKVPKHWGQNLTRPQTYSHHCLYRILINKKTTGNSWYLYNFYIEKCIFFYLKISKICLWPMSVYSNIRMLYCIKQDKSDEVYLWCFMLKHYWVACRTDWLSLRRFLAKIGGSLVNASIVSFWKPYLREKCRCTT